MPRDEASRWRLAAGFEPLGSFDITALPGLSPCGKCYSMTPWLCRFVIAGLLLADSPVASFAADDQASRFDGNWDVTLTCPRTADGRALGYSYEFSARAKDGLLQGERGIPGKPGWLSLTGPIKSDGSAALIAEGVTNLPAYALYAVERGTHFKHAVSAQFEATRGSGSWITIRTCTFDFEKQ
jgi:hypothetical protein